MSDPTRTNLWHGYTLTDIDQLAHTAARRAYSSHILDPDDAHETAWGTIVEHLATTTNPPHPKTLLTIAYQAITAEAQQVRHHRGMPRTWGAHTGTNTAFCRYWELIRRVTASPEDKIVDRRALVQIWHTLTPWHQQVLYALALHDGNHHAAAAMLGISNVRTYRNHLSHARAAYRALWHEHETPSRMWGRSGTRGTATAVRVLGARLRARERRTAATAAGGEAA